MGSLTGRGKKAELMSVEFKVDFDGSSRAWLQLVVEGAALANSGGGVLIYGVGDDGERRGAPGADQADLDAATLNDRLRQYSPQSTFRCSIQRFSYYRRHFVAVGFGPSDGIIVFDKDGNYHDSGRTQTAFRSGLIYVRRTGQKGPATQAEISGIVRRLSDRQSAEFLTRVEKVVGLPSGADIIAVPAGSAEQGLLLTGSGVGVPVRVEVDPEVEALPVSEIADSSAPYGSLEVEVAQQVRFWRRSDSEHRIRPSTLAMWYRRRGEVAAWDSQACDLAVRSSLDNREFPNYWASKLSVSELRDVVSRVIAEPKYPSYNEVIYLICSQLWDDRLELLGQIIDGKSKYQDARRIARKMLSMERAPFLSSARYQGRSFWWKGKDILLATIQEDPSIGEGVMEEMLAQAKMQSGQRQIAHQLDILLYARR